ncbi:hypothetical protein IV64_GL001709 [Lactiplantibacillus xiangfangensis]|uniref:Uncharacterized protein n=1 Tax=Lactiplantibacillus xiangfangensis TaxID=942150 RepID=A0A0R2MKJ6_9LACO|nr:hypothetical protein [Lactiplantibacillus xiangfangensis]KRO14225.1 hypothetical protein IV64_GL001709 [Lactiplantibacillus xiangfangensis]
MKIKIVPPKGSSEKPYVKEFNNWDEVNAYLLRKNEPIWEAIPQNEAVNFDMNEIN